MNIDKINDFHAKITFKNYEVSLINALRRIMISEVPTIAIETMKVYTNNGLLTDETIAHRIGLIPIKRLDPFIKNVNLTLDIENTDDKLLTVYSGNFKIDDNSEQRIIITDPNIIITKLDKGHKIHITAETDVGIGQDHAKWSPVCGAGHSIETDDDNNKYITLNVETIGTMTYKEVYDESINILIEKLKILKNAI